MHIKRMTPEDFQRLLSDPELGPPLRGSALGMAHEHLAEIIKSVSEEVAGTLHDDAMKSVLITWDTRVCDRCKGNHPEVTVITGKDDQEIDPMLLLGKVIEMLHSEHDKQGH